MGAGQYQVLTEQDPRAEHLSRLSPRRLFSQSQPPTLLIHRHVEP